MAALSGVGILVTRPRAQAQSLSTLFEGHGARTWCLPMLEIHGLALPEVAGPFDLAVFTSANAVRHAGTLLERLGEATLAAIGPATARALRHAGYTVHLQPQGGVDSEALLAHPRLAHLSGRKVLLVKGRGGRDLLEREMTARGAQVHSVESYERVPAPCNGAALSALQRHAAAGEVHVVTISSAEIGLRLLEMLTPPLRRALGGALWIVPSARVAGVLQERGLQAVMRVARSADDQDLLACVLECRGPSSA